MSAPSPMPGWYPDPAGGADRWWDGRAWTEFRNASVVAIVQPPLPEGASTRTLWIFLQAVLPLVQVLAQLPYLLSFARVYAVQLSLMRGQQGSAFSDAAARALLAQYVGLLGTFAVTGALSLVTSAAWVVLAALDSRRLARIGIVQPFHWAWSFLGLVYPIGRAVVLRRRIGHGLEPMWLLIGTLVASTVLVVVLQVSLLLPTFLELISSAAHASAVSG